MVIPDRQEKVVGYFTKTLTKKENVLLARSVLSAVGGVRLRYDKLEYQYFQSQLFKLIILNVKSREC